MSMSATEIAGKLNYSSIELSLDLNYTLHVKRHKSLYTFQILAEFIQTGEGVIKYYVL
jgi:hypothetical protein